MARNIDIRLRRSAVPGNVPTVEQLNLGELAINTHDGKLFLKKEYDGGIEQIVEVGAFSGAGLSSTFNNYIYTSDGTMATVEGLDDAGNFLTYDLSTPSRLQVYLNGVLLHQGIDYTANDGESINFSYAIDSDQVVQVATYNSEGASFNNDFILDDGYSFTVGTNEETKFYHNSVDTIIKHYGYNDGQFKIMYRDSDRLSVDDMGIYITGNFRLNGSEVVNLNDVIAQINLQVDKDFVEDLNLTAGAITYTPDSDQIATNVQQAIDELHDRKLDVSALAANVVFYPTSATTDINGTYTRLVTTKEDSDYDTVAVDINTGEINTQNQLIAELASDKGVLVGNTGVINIHTVGNVRRVAASGYGVAEFYFEVYKRDSDGVEELMGASSNTREVSETNYEEFIADALINSTTFLASDRVVMKYYGNDKSALGNAEFEFQFGGDQPVRTQFPVPVSIIPHVNDADEIFTHTSNFDGILSGNDDDVQKALDTIDDITTADIPEDSASLFFTADRARQSLSGGLGIDFNSITGEIEVDYTIATKVYAESYTETYADSHDAITLLSAQNYSDTQDSATLQSAQNYADSNDAVTLSAANEYTDTEIVNVLLEVDSAISDAIVTAGINADSAINIAITNLVDGAPEVLDTLNEIAEALGDDSDFIGTVQNWINQKLDASATTDDITEGIYNKYFTESRVRDSLSVSNGLTFDPLSGEFGIDSSDDVTFNTVTASTFIGDLQGNADTATNADQLDGNHGSFYRIDVYDINGTLVN